MKTKLIVLLLYIFPFTSFSQNNSMGINETLRYITRQFIDYDIEIPDFLLQIKKYSNYVSQEYEKYGTYKFTKESVITFTYNEMGSPYYNCSFNILNVSFGEIRKSSASYSFDISCNNNNECIKVHQNVRRKISFTSSSETALNRFRNALIHLNTITRNDPKYNNSNIDPFDELKIDALTQNSISISNLIFKDNNNNNRIDESETSSLIVSLKNHNQQNVSNISLEIKEVNNIKGITFQQKHNVPTLNNNQNRNVEISINSNNQLEIGEANFVIRVLNNNKVEITKKSVKIATFNSGPQEILISKLPDIDINIPKTLNVRRNTYAIVIGNEDYKSKQPNLSYEANVKYAVNDAKIFKEYLINTIGIPNSNITYLTNATSAQIKQAINKVTQLPLVNSNAEIIFYYAGHGLPDEKNKEQYLIPVDVNSSNLSFGLKINEIESELSSNNPKQVLLILDACFSGAARNESLLSNRAVRVRPKENIIKGNSIILSASSNEEASKAYDEMQHGMFTYFLLKKIQETKGNVDLQTLFDFLHFNVREKSLLINNQFQTPTITKSPQIQNNLNEIKF